MEAQRGERCHGVGALMADGLDHSKPYRSQRWDNKTPCIFCKGMHSPDWCDQDPKWLGNCTVDGHTHIDGRVPVGLRERIVAALGYWFCARCEALFPVREDPRSSGIEAGAR